MSVISMLLQLRNIQFLIKEHGGAVAFPSPLERKLMWDFILEEIIRVQAPRTELCPEDERGIENASQVDAVATPQARSARLKSVGKFMQNGYNKVYSKVIGPPRPIPKSVEEMPVIHDKYPNDGKLMCRGNEVEVGEWAIGDGGVVYVGICKLFHIHFTIASK